MSQDEFTHSIPFTFPSVLHVLNFTEISLMAWTNNCPGDLLKNALFVNIVLCILGIKPSGIFLRFGVYFCQFLFSSCAISLLPKHVGAKQLTLEDPQMTMNHPYTMTAPYASLPAQVW